MIVLIIISVSILFIAFVSSCNDKPSKESIQTDEIVKHTATIEITPSPEPTPIPKITFGDKIRVEEFEIVFEKYEIVPIDNMFADNDEAIIVTSHITNVTDETHSLVGIDIVAFTPEGIEGDNQSAYFVDEYNTNKYNELRAGSTYEYHLIIAYEGEGEYIIEARSWLGEEAEDIYFDVVYE